MADENESKSETLPVPVRNSFEGIKQQNPFGAEYWNARDLQALLGYTQWRSFENAIKKAMTSCQQSGNDAAHHFARARRMVALGSGSQREVPDFQLSRFACYLIAQNGDPRKPQIAFAQKYFAIQTRRQELSDAYVRDQERLELRQQTAQEFKALSGVGWHGCRSLQPCLRHRAIRPAWVRGEARRHGCDETAVAAMPPAAGVANRMFGIFHDAGYKGLYGGIGSQQIKARKGISQSENLLDRMDTTELAANQFRMTQTREKLARDRIKGEHRAIDTHRAVGKEVRDAIKRIGGTMPEIIPPAEDIRQVAKRLKQSTPKLQLEGPDAKGLAAGGEQSK